MSYQLVEQLHKKAVPVGRLCRVLGVSRSGYYGCRQRAKLAPKACLVSTQLKAEFAASGKVYGSRRLSAVLCAQGLRTGRHRVRRLMREHGLRALWRRKFVHTTDSGHALPISANVLARRFNRKRPANPSTRDEPLQAPSCPRKPSWTPCLKKLPIRTTLACASAASTARNSRLN